MDYIMNGSEYRLTKLSEIDGKRITPRWIKSIPISSGIGSTLHFDNKWIWDDHFDTYEKSKKIKASKTKVERNGIVTVSPFYPTKISKNDDEEIVITPNPWLDGSNPKPKISTEDLGKEFIIKSDKALEIWWASIKKKS